MPKKPRSPMPALADLLCFSIYSTGHAFNRIYKPLLDPLALTYPQYLVMVALWEEDDQTVGALGAKLSLESSTLTPLLKRLEANGRITRRRDRTDERQVRIALTDAGHALKAAAQSVPPCIMEASGLDLAALSRLVGEITRLRDALERHADAASSPA